MFLTCAFLGLLSTPAHGRDLMRRESKKSISIESSGKVQGQEKAVTAEKLLAKYPQHSALISLLKQDAKQGHRAWSSDCTDDAAANKATLFEAPLPGTWAEAKQRQMTKCLAIYDNSLCSRVVEQLYKKQPTGTAAFVPDKAFCEESADLLQAADLQTDGTAMIKLDSGRRRRKGSSNICTALYLAGRLPAEIWQADDDVGSAMQVSWIGLPILRGYQLWSRPLAQMMLQSPLLLNLLEPLGSSWAKTMAWLRGSTHPEAQPHILALIASIIGVPICFILGLMCELNILAAFIAVGLCVGVARSRKVKGA